MTIDYFKSTDVRVAHGTGEKREPTMTSLALASHKSEEHVVDWLAQEKYFYNVIINLHNHTIKFMRHDHEDLVSAVKSIRSRAVGVSVYTDHGFLQRRDINTEAISIGIIGTDEEFQHKATYMFLVESIKELCKKFNIKFHKVLSYPMLAIYPNGVYERASIERNHIINWQKLASLGLGLWPSKKHHKTKIPFKTQEESVRWVAQGLNKLGMMAAVTGKNKHKQLKSAVKAFQKHYQLKNQKGVVDKETILALNSLLEQKEKYEPELKVIEPLTLKKYAIRKKKEFQN